MENLRLYERPTQRSAFARPVADLEMGELAPARKGVEWSVSVPQNVLLYTLHPEILVQEEPVGKVDAYSWLYEDSEVWRWILTPVDLARLEKLRDDQDLQMTLRCAGIALVGDTASSLLSALSAVRGKLDLTVPRQRWEEILTRLGYLPT